MHDFHEVRLGERIAMRPRRPSAGPVAARGRLVIDPDERKSAVVGNVRQDVQAPALATESAESAALRQRRRGQTDQQSARDYESPSSVYTWVRLSHRERAPLSSITVPLGA